MAVYQGHNSGGNHNYNAYIYDNCTWYLHFHKNFELAYVMEGQTELLRNGESFLLKPGQFALLLPHEFHGYRTPEHSRVWVGVFSADFVGSFAKMLENKRADKPVFTCEAPVLEFLRSFLLTSQPQEVLMLKSALYAVCSAFMQQVTLTDVSQDHGFVQRVLTYLSENFRKEATLEEFARLSGYTYHYVSRQFHRHFPMHFKQLLNIYRTEFARDQLLYTEESITRIALLSGYQNSRSFNRAFLAQMGMTPTEFRGSRVLPGPVTYPQQPIFRQPAKK